MTKISRVKRDFLREFASLAYSSPFSSMVVVFKLLLLSRRGASQQ